MNHYVQQTFFRALHLLRIQVEGPADGAVGGTLGDAQVEHNRPAHSDYFTQVKLPQGGRRYKLSERSVDREL